MENSEDPDNPTLDGAAALALTERMLKEVGEYALGAAVLVVLIILVNGALRAAAARQIADPVGRVAGFLGANGGS